MISSSVKLDAIEGCNPNWGFSCQVEFGGVPPLQDGAQTAETAVNAITGEELGTRRAVCEL
jgi:hypothetical protein